MTDTIEPEGATGVTVTLSERMKGRDNNLNLVRIVAALCVLVSHAVAITSGSRLAEPLRSVTGISLGHFAVCIFFCISGLLIAKSFDRRTSLQQFCKARALRIMPGLFVALCFTVFVFGPIVTEANLASYFSAAKTWMYVPRNLTLFLRVDRLPGVFTTNPLSNTVNGSLWSLSYEVFCYGFVVVSGYAGVLRRRLPILVVVVVTALANILFSMFPVSSEQMRKLEVLALVGFPFALGMAAYVFQNLLVLRKRYVVAGCLLTLALWQTPFRHTALITTLSYAIFWIAFVPRGRLLVFNMVGDFSYGAYIYAFPVQQSVTHFLPEIGVVSSIFTAGALTLVLAALSWFLVEKPALRLASVKPDALASRQLDGVKVLT